MKKPKTLRKRMMGAIFFSLLLLWAVVMFMLHRNTVDRIEIEVFNQISESERMLRSDIQGVLEGTLPTEDKQALIEYYLSNNANILNGRDGALSFRMYDPQGKETVRTQLAYGMADTEIDYGSKRYHLSMDEALDDEGMLAYLNWIVAHRDRSHDYELRAPEGYRYPGDGTVALVTGVVENNHIRVQRIALRHPDGSESLVLEGKNGAFTGEKLTTIEFPTLTLESPLLPILWWNDKGQRSEKVDLKARLARYRFAERKMDAFYAESGAPTNMVSSGGYVNYEGRYDGTSLAQGFYYSAERLAGKELLSVYLFTLMVVVAMGLLLSRELSHRLAEPLEELSQAAEKSQPCAENGGIKEVNALAAAFNAARKKLSDDLRREQDLTRAVAHELKTPLAILRSHAEALSEDIDPAKREQYLSIIMDESDRMAALVGELLDLSRMEAGAEELKRETVDLDGLTRRVFSRIESLTRVTLQLESVTVQGDEALLERAISNYASNALRHCRRGGEIRVTLRREGELARLTVENDGDPIPPDALPRLWDTFYKADAARTRGAGTGLGLAIVRGVVKLHCGDCGAQNLPDGPSFWLALPCNPADPMVS